MLEGPSNAYCVYIRASIYLGGDNGHLKRLLRRRRNSSLWSLILLATHPRAQDIFREEVQTPKGETIYPRPSSELHRDKRPAKRKPKPKKLKKRKKKEC